MLSIIFEGKIVILVPFFLYSSLFNTLWVTIIPTTLHYTNSLSDYIYITAYFSMSFAVGSLIICFFTTQLSETFEDFAMRPLMVFGSVAQLDTLCMDDSMIPSNSSIQPTDEPSLLIQPSIFPLLALASLFGVADAANKTTRTMICARLIPDLKHQVFGAARFYTSLAASTVFFASSQHVRLRRWTGCLIG
ncbi:hypothetical protein PENTCL1PPCAC_15849, partial [Pristionchus entomophagus]